MTEGQIIAILLIILFLIWVFDPGSRELRRKLEEEHKKMSDEDDHLDW